MLNNPLRYIDPSGHSSVLHDSYGDASSSTLMINPWILDRDDKPSFTVYQSRAESDFVKKMNDPGVGLTVTTKFGANNTMGGKGQHAGVDFRGAWKSNTEIRATSYGVVVDVTTDPEADMGLKVIVEHDVYGVKYYSVYGHLCKTAVREGQLVNNTTTIGLMGNTPFGSVHLHFEVRKSANVNLDDQGRYSSFPTSAGSWWADTYGELRSNWVDLGPKYGYDHKYPVN